MPCNAMQFDEAHHCLTDDIFIIRSIYEHPRSIKREYIFLFCVFLLKSYFTGQYCGKLLKFSAHSLNVFIDNTQPVSQVWVPWKLQLIAVKMRQWSCWRLLSQVRWNDPIFIFILWYMNIYYIIYKYIISPCNLSNKIKTKMCRLREEEARKIESGINWQNLQQN